MSVIADVLSSISSPFSSMDESPSTSTSPSAPPPKQEEVFRRRYINHDPNHVRTSISANGSAPPLCKKCKTRRLGHAHPRFLEDDSADKSLPQCKYVDRKLVCPKGKGYPERIDEDGLPICNQDDEHAPSRRAGKSIPVHAMNPTKFPPSKSLAWAVLCNSLRFLWNVIRWLVALCYTILLIVYAIFKFIWMLVSKLRRIRSIKAEQKTVTPAKGLYEATSTGSISAVFNGAGGVETEDEMGYYPWDNY